MKSANQNGSLYKQTPENSPLPNSEFKNDAPSHLWLESNIECDIALYIFNFFQLGIAIISIAKKKSNGSRTIDRPSPPPPHTQKTVIWIKFFKIGF